MNSFTEYYIYKSIRLYYVVKWYVCVAFSSCGGHVYVDAYLSPGVCLAFNRSKRNALSPLSRQFYKVLVWCVSVVGFISQYYIRT